MSPTNTPGARRATGTGTTRLRPAVPAKPANAALTRQQDAVARPARPGPTPRTPRTPRAARRPTRLRWTVRDRICAVTAGTGAGSILAVLSLAPLHAPATAFGAVGAVGSGAVAAIGIYLAKK